MIYVTLQARLNHPFDGASPSENVKVCRENKPANCRPLHRRAAVPCHAAVPFRTAVPAGSGRRATGMQVGRPAEDLFVEPVLDLSGPSPGRPSAVEI